MHQKQQFYIKHTIACGHKHHKLTNLSIANGMDNVLAVISDKKLAVCSATNSIYYLIDVASATDYSPFGAPLPERQYTAGLQATHTVAADHFNGSTTGWQAHGANSVVSSYCGNLRAVITNRGSQGQGMKKTFATTPGQLYKVSFLINVMAWPALVITDPTTGAELLRTPTNMPGHYSYTFMAQSTHTTIAFEEIVATNSTILLCNFTLQEVGGGYAFGGAGGQQKDDEIFIGAYTAEFWEYDSRLGRRWNVDPVVKPWESPYATFSNTPISKVDKDGDNPIGVIIGAVAGTVKEVVGQTISNGLKNMNDGKGFFDGWAKNIDWADVAIGAGEGALLGTTMGLSLIGTSAVSSTLKGAVDWKNDDKGIQVIFGSKGHNKRLSDAFADASANFVGSLIGSGMGIDKLGNGLARETFKNTSGNLAKLGVGVFSGVVESSIGGIWQYGINEIKDDLLNRYHCWYNLNHSIMLNEVVISFPKNDEIKSQNEQKTMKQVYPEVESKKPND